MKRHGMIFGLLWVSVVFVSQGWAAQRTFVSGSGLDTNPCTLAAPCRGFAAAISNTDAGGEVIVLDSAGYGPVTIDKSVSIISPPGVYAGISVFFGNGITINAGGLDTVTLKGLAINGLGGTSGIVANTIGTLNVDRCAISGFINNFGNGITFKAPDSRLIVKDTDVTRTLAGVEINNASGTVNATLDGVHLDRNMYGFWLTLTGSATALATITNSTASQNSECGFVSENYGSSAMTELSLEHCVASHNGQDGVWTINANQACITRISNCTITNNGGYGVRKMDLGTIFTRQNNTIHGNGTDVSPAMTVLSGQ